MQFKKILDLVAVIGATQDIDEMRRIVLQELRRLIWFDGANFGLIDPLTGLPQEKFARLDTPAESIKPYLNYYIHLDEVLQAHRDSGLLVARSTDLLKYGEWTRRSEYYNDFLQTYHTHYLLGLNIKKGRTGFAMLCLYRDKSTGNFRPEDVQALQILYPHLLNWLQWRHALAEAAHGRFWSSRERPALNVPGFSFESLTPRELDVVQMVLTGLANREIAESLKISVNTVRMHLQNIFAKLGIKRRGQLLALYLTAERAAGEG